MMSSQASSSPHTARREHGMCRGSLWKQHMSGVEQKKSDESGQRKTFEYCVLVGVTLTAYCDYTSYRRGDYPMTLVRIVGASAWNHSSATSSADSSTSRLFRMVTFQGTHIICETQTSRDAEVWLGALHAGLEASLTNTETPLVLPPPSPKRKSNQKPKMRRGRSKTTSMCLSCGRSQEEYLPLQACPLPQYGKEARCDVCPSCLVCQGLFLDIQRLSELYSVQEYEQQALRAAREQCWHTLASREEKNANALDDAERDDNDDGVVSTESTQALLSLIQSASFGSYRRICPLLDSQCRMLEQGGSPAEFFEGLNTGQTKEEMQVGALKKQAFRVAGDMGSAMKLLQDYALGNHDTDMLSYILEFLLDLCEEGELSSVAFFWPQLRCIHLRMLPPENTREMNRVDLLEDFLLTVSTKHSVKLALELVWGHVADLEDSLYNPNCSAACRRRRFSVLRFVCELESLVFDFDYGWGGGSVSLRSTLSPSPHQVTLLRQAMISLQNHRSQVPALTRSVRIEKLKHVKLKMPPEEAAKEALRIARNADYFSSHLSFTRRICDIADRLRFMDVEVRAPTLEKELVSLNSSGGMGGDPLNRAQDSLMRVVRIPPREGHVFRSKERTPVLLLMEILREGVDEEAKDEDDDIFARRQQLPLTDVNGRGTPEVERALDSDAAIEIQEDELPRGDNEKGSDIAESTSEYLGASEPGSSESATGTSLGVEEEINVDSDVAQDPSLKSVDPGDDENSLEGEKDTVHELADSIECVEQTELLTSTSKGDAYSVTKEKAEVIRPISPAGQDLPPHHSPRALGKLRRFDGDQEVQNDSNEIATPTKSAVKKMVSTALSKNLNLPPLGENECTTSGETGKDDLGVGDLGNDDAEPKPEECTGERSVATSRLNRNPWTTSSRKMSAFGSGSELRDSSGSFPNDEIRREVLTTIMMKGMKGNNAIASSAAAAAQRSLQDLDRKRAVELILHDENDSQKDSTGSPDARHDDLEHSRRKLRELGLDQASIEQSLEDDTRSVPSEEDEAMEALRLLLLQNRAGQGIISPESAEQALRTSSLRSVTPRSPGSDSDGALDESEMIEIDAGDVDSRLAGCGSLPPAVLSALTLWKADVVTNGELLELVKKDLNYIRHCEIHAAENTDKLIEDSKFWGRFAFGERWAEKKARLSASSPEGSLPGWDLIGIIVKSNDDLRQEAFVMQLIELCQEAFEMAGLDLWLYPYRILATGKTTGIIEMVRNAMSFDALKKRPGYGRSGLRGHLKRMTEFTADPSNAFRTAQKNFVRSLAAYSLLSYLFLFKDRHNGNILLDTAGHVIHIDFGFVFGVAPGGSFSLEMSTPFKLTDEMLDVMGGLESALFSEFVTLFCCGFLALQAHVDTFATIVEITCNGSNFKCFDGRGAEEVVSKLRERFVPHLDKEATVAYALDLIKQATTSYGTKQYDYFQYLSQGIAA